MKSAGFMARADDLLNPIVVKELRQAVKSRVVMAALLLFLFLQLTILLVILLAGEYRSTQTVNLHAGRKTFEVLQGILLGTCMLLIPVYAGVRLAAEHSDTNVDLLFISTLRARAIIAGKFQASIVLILLIFSACAPFMTFTYLLRGIDIPSILMVLGMDFLAVLLGTQLAIFLGTVPANWGLKILLGLIGLGCLGVLFGTMMKGSLEMLELGLGPLLGTLEFWLIAGAIVVAVVAVIGLLFAWSVAIVTPPSANRALPVRLYLLAAWLVTGGVAAYLTRRFVTPIPLYFWMDGFILLLCVQILTAINERDRWGLRVTRTIPRRWWLRGPAFLLYSGAAGGIGFALLLIALTIGPPSYLLSLERDSFFHLSRGKIDVIDTNTLVMVLIILYTFNYSMTAVVLRNMLLPRRLKSLFTWLLALLLGGLGCSLPFIFLFLFNNEGLRSGRINPWWYITNPAVTIYNIVMDWRSEVGEDFRTGVLWFLVVWAVLMILLCLPWMGRQIGRFRPPERVDVVD
ncbi:MAG TPA: hypothetical protein VN688_01220 [Gemmataceae bacterium]|nr:hypothetical protein [Gemmataceae bacterium]